MSLFKYRRPSLDDKHRALTNEELKKELVEMKKPKVEKKPIKKRK